MHLCIARQVCATLRRAALDDIIYGVPFSAERFPNRHGLTAALGGIRLDP